MNHCRKLTIFCILLGPEGTAGRADPTPQGLPFYPKSEGWNVAPTNSFYHRRETQVHVTGGPLRVGSQCSELTTLPCLSATPLHRPDEQSGISRV